MGVTAKASHVRGYWDFEQTKDPKTKEPLHYGFHLKRAIVPSGKDMQYLSINAGRYYNEKSEVAISEFIMYKGALDDKQVNVFLYSLGHTLTHSPTHSLTQSLTHLLTHLLTHSLTRNTCNRAFTPHE